MPTLRQHRAAARALASLAGFGVASTCRIIGIMSNSGFVSAHGGSSTFYQICVANALIDPLGKPLAPICAEGSSWVAVHSAARVENPHLVALVPIVNLVVAREHTTFGGAQEHR
jgi:hypothetical protein